MVKEYFNVTETAEYLGYKTTHSVYSMINNGLPVIKVNGISRIRKSDIDAFMDAHKTVVTKPTNSKK